MTQPKTKRQFEQRMVDSFDRSRIRDVARATKGQKLKGLRKRYATLLIGCSLAVGGIGAPMKFAEASKARHKAAGNPGSIVSGIGGDLMAAQAIAREVTGGVEAAAETVADLSPSSAAKDLKLITEKAREEFFRKEVPFGELIYKEAKKNDLAPELVAAVVKTESQFKPNARSPRNAQGLMQLVPRTGRWMGAKNLMNPVENVRAGTKYLKYLEERFDGDETKMIAAYNAGEGNVRKFGGIPPFRETRNYVRKVENSVEDFEEQISGRLAEQANLAVVAPVQTGP
jgi:soluble lytic murein transglycosylase-like protein